MAATHVFLNLPLAHNQPSSQPHAWVWFSAVDSGIWNPDLGRGYLCSAQLPGFGRLVGLEADFREVLELHPVDYL